ncbi:TetR/AcrR family transcriptional regulator [Methylorubrum populi]|uniref:TetR/AcrR family transcriptional regulator n=1 Tax=Methylorubrum rhodesianum TaxID=29427 RepID=A0ABU9ZGR6_9HYPH|nr:TetR/AcrR family transcriptional regulator [Methylorubrum rhodesianum]MBK3405308.1 TetR/AcrR family transcriptional regulator [Methylorubrum rhodesianum]MBY0141940.1 TetR/AcrR family transcriptional regulator [Methylorubrum populi]
MGRPRSIDRDKILDIAERIVREEGATALTFDAVAKAAGITKGGLQYCFGSKDDLIAALADRWLKGFDAEIVRHTPPNGNGVDRARAYVTASARIDEVTQAKMAGMLVSLLQSPGHLEQARGWYAEWMKRLEPGSEGERRARTAFFAAEGAFFLRSLGLVEMDQAGWDVVFDDILKLL